MTKETHREPEGLRLIFSFAKSDLCTAQSRFPMTVRRWRSELMDRRSTPQQSRSRISGATGALGNLSIGADHCCGFATQHASRSLSDHLYAVLD